MAAKEQENWNSALKVMVLYHMVRNIVWHLVEVGKGTKSIAAFKSEFGRQASF
ncbi:MAG: hypothetical protein ACLR2G_08195 [Phascolarctobacterium faecium]